MKRQSTKSHPFFNRLAFSLVAFALALAALQQFRPSRANALTALAAAATPTPTPVPKTDFDIYPLNSTGVVQAKSGGASWLGNVPGYNIARVFKNINNQSHVIMLNGNTGRGKTYQLDSDGSLGTLMWETGNDVISDLRCTSAETVKIGTTIYLITHDSFTGRVRTFHLYDNGQPNLGSMGVTTLNDWKDKNIFSLYYFDGAYYLLGVDTWTGNAVAYSINGQKIGEDDWSRGWTSVDHLAVGGVTYRLLYKAAGDPYKKEGEANDQRGRFVVQKVNANGVTGQNIYDAPIGADFSSVRFAPLYNGQGFDHGLFFFKRDTRHYVVRQFDKQSGVGAITAFGLIKDGPQFDDVAPAYVDIEPYTIGVKTFIATVSDNNSTPFYFADVEKMAHTIHDGLKNKVVGYQFMLAQSGRVIYSRGWGKKHLSPDPNVNAVSNNYDMTTNTSHSLVSISKMITAMTILKLAEMGEIDLDSPIDDYLPADQKVPGGWAETMSVRNLLMHTSGVTKGQSGCSAKEGEFDPNDLPQVNCKPFFQATQDSGPCELKNGKMVCARSYNNANFSALRKIIEFKTGAKSSQEIVAKTRELWADSIDLSGLTCQYGASVYYFGQCKGLDDCFAFNGQSWQQGQSSPLWDEGCGAGGWNASSRQLVEFLSAIRYRKFLNSSMTNQLLDTTLEDSNDGATALAWSPPWSAGGEKNLGKGGDSPGNDFETHTYMTRLPNNCDAVILVNTDVSDNPLSLLTGAYKYATGENSNPPIYYDIATNGKGDGGTISRVAVNTVKTSASENQHVVAVRDSNGSLELVAYNVSPDDGEVVFKDDDVAGTADGALAIPATELAITDGVNFATASLGNDGKLAVISWNYDGANLTQYGLGFGATAQEVAVTKTHGTGSTGRVVTAIRTAAGNLRLDVWEFNNTNKTVTLKDSYTAGAAQEIAIKTLRFGPYMSSTARVVTALRNGDNKLQVDVWDLDSNGQLNRQGKGLLGEVTATTNSLFKVAIDTDSDGGDFFNTAGFMTAFVNGDGKLQVATWYADVAGAVKNKTTGVVGQATDDAVYNAAVVDIAASASTITTRKATSNELVTIKWKINADGGIAGYSDRGDDLTVDRVSAAGNFFTAFQLTNDKLRVYHWKITE